MKQHRVSSLAVLCLALSSTIISCQKEDLSANNAPATEAPATAGSIEVPDSGVAMATALASTTTTTTTAPT
ncbi:MAG: hypothetical protein EOO11_13970, partial [Chitinophagaceae bacterium]